MSPQQTAAIRAAQLAQVEAAREAAQLAAAEEARAAAEQRAIGRTLAQQVRGWLVWEGGGLL